MKKTRAAEPAQRVVGVGASAGGLEALKQLVMRLPVDTGLAFVVMQHLPPSQTGQLARLLATWATLPVVDVRSGRRVEPNTILVVPPRTAAKLFRGALVLRTAKPGTRPRLPIDDLLRSLAATLGDRAIGVVLSGTGRDGTEGLRAIRDAGGLTAAQDPSTAQFDEMPRSAIAAGVAELVLAPPQIGEQLGPIAARARPLRVAAPVAALEHVLEQLRDASGVDFTSYKRTTIERRLQRRLGKLALSSLAEYSAYLAANPAEHAALYEDLLVHVTEFFRDPPMFERLSASVLPDLIRGKPAGAPLRVWVPGCATGEEVYSLAIALLELLGPHGEPQLFGTDLSERAIEVARRGTYPAAIAAHVSPARLERFFRRDAGGYRIRSEVRDRCVFVRHDITSDPPFSRLDLVSCRNVLIYLGTALQRRVLSTLHYALEQPGYLVLGKTESAAGLDAMFTLVDPDARIYARKPAPRTALGFPIGGPARPPVARGRDAVRIAFDVQRDLDHVLLARYAPACVLVDEQLDVVQFRGHTGAYLEPPAGQPQLNVLRMAREGLASELSLALQRARRGDAPVRHEGVVVPDGARSRTVHIEVVPLRGGIEATRYFLVVFEPAPSALPAATQRRGRRVSAARSERGGAELVRLRQELAATKEYLRSVVTQHVATCDELGLANEELQSANEELQSGNEELQTAKEELQSANEELETVNDELQRGNEQLRAANDDLVNVLASVDIAIIIVDTERRIRRFTPRAQGLVKLIAGDLGRPIGDLRLDAVAPGLDASIAEVIATHAVHDSEVAHADGSRYRMQIRPYRTSEQVYDGAVIAFLDVTALRAEQREVERLREVTLRERDQFLDAVSHELRTPLSAILLWAEALGGLAHDDPRRARAIEAIVDSARSEARLVDDLVELALSRSGRLTVAPEPVDAAPIVAAAVDDARPAAADKQIAIETAIDSGARLVADPRRLHQIAAGLIGNAIKFTPPSGRVWVRLARAADRLALTVRDDGPGIAPEFLARAFEPFEQADQSSTRAHRGLGVGLALVRHLVERHGGSIDVDSDGVRGTTFTVRLPA